MSFRPFFLFWKKLSFYFSVLNTLKTFSKLKKATLLLYTRKFSRLKNFSHIDAAIRFFLTVFSLEPSFFFLFTPRGIRIPVFSVKGRCPRPLDDGGFWGYFKLDSAELDSQPFLCSLYQFCWKLSNFWSFFDNCFSMFTPCRTWTHDIRFWKPAFYQLN